MSAKPVATDTLHVVFVWDMSGSMGSIEDASREGFGQYLADLKAEEGETLMSLTVFDGNYEQWFIATPVEKIPAKTAKRWVPRGSTALYDAIAKSISDTDAKLKEDGREKEKVLVVIMTDGMENASTEYALRDGGAKRLKKLIQRYERKGNWTFSYLGANVDAWAEAQAIAIPAGNVTAYAANKVSTGNAYANVSANTSALRNSPQSSSENLSDLAGTDQDVR